MTENDLKIAKMIVLENVITVVVCCILVLGLYYMGADGYSFMGLALLLNITSSSKKDTQETWILNNTYKV